MLSNGEVLAHARDAVKLVCNISFLLGSAQMGLAWRGCCRSSDPREGPLLRPPGHRHFLNSVTFGCLPVAELQGGTVSTGAEPLKAA